MPGFFAHTMRPALLAASRADGLRRTVEHSPVSRRVVRRFVPGDTLDDVLDSVAVLRDSGRHISIDYLAENVTDVIIRTDLEGLHEYVSPASFTVLGYRPEELVGTMMHDIVHPEAGPEITASI